MNRGGFSNETEHSGPKRLARIGMVAVEGNGRTRKVAWTMAKEGPFRRRTFTHGRESWAVTTDFLLPYLHYAANAYTNTVPRTGHETPPC